VLEESRAVDEQRMAALYTVGVASDRNEKHRDSMEVRCVRDGDSGTAFGRRCRTRGGVE
jgi:hypothetical protein